MKIMTLEKDGIKITINFLGIKITFPYTQKINYPIENTVIEKLKTNLKENTVLMLEANDFHGEIMPGYVKYLIDLGYNVDLLATEHHLKDLALCRLETDKLQTYYTNISTIEKIIQNPEIMNRYSGFFINTLGLFRKDRNIKSPAFINKYFKAIHLPNNGFCINVCHNIDQLKSTSPKLPNCITLGKTKIDLPIVNPCYFGNISITPKNNKTVFLVSGDLKRNFSMIEDAVKRIVDLGITNFDLYITGRKKFLLTDNNLSKYIHFLGYVNFKELYSLLEQSDFIIPCLDPNNKEHECYLDICTSGCFQLSYGFCKPMIITEKFAEKALVDSKSAILYKQNEDLYEAMIKAINMNYEQYNLVQNKIRQITEKLYEKSRNNLKNIIVGAYSHND